MAANYYHLLGIETRADERSIRYAYRTTAKRFHPDRFVSAPPYERAIAESKMRDLNEAYEVLSDPPRRRLYDECMRTGRSFRDALEEQAAAQVATDDENERSVIEALELLERRLDVVAAEVIANKIAALDDTVAWKDRIDGHYERVLACRRSGRRIVVKIKLLPELTPEIFQGYVDDAVDTVENSTASFQRWEYVHLVVARELRSEAGMLALAAEHNERHWRVLSPLSPRSYIAWVDARDGTVHAPEVTKADPDLPSLELRLASLYR